MKEPTCLINPKSECVNSTKQSQGRSRRTSLLDSLSPVNDQPISVGITKRRPMANLRSIRSEEEGDIVVAQVSESGFKIVDFKCN
jgi:ribosomal protein L28